MSELALIAGTRVALGMGIGFLVAESLTREQRRTAGWTLLALGALSTIPLAADVFSRRAAHDPDYGPAAPTVGGPPGSRPWLSNAATSRLG
jgi:hypothetical protein